LFMLFMLVDKQAYVTELAANPPVYYS